MTTQVLFCGPHFPASHAYTREYLQSHPSIKVDVVPLNGVHDVIGNYDICVVKSMRLNSDIITRANKMKLIMQFGVGLEGVDVNAATRHGIKVARIPSYGSGNAASCAEMAIYLILALLRKQYEMQIAVRQKRLGDPIGDTLLGKTVFIMGFGDIGIQLAKRLQPFGVKILATKRNWPSSSSPCNFSDESIHDDLVDEKGSHDEDILKFASRADIVVCCLAMNTETAGIVDKAFISSMRKGALLVNIARGELLDYDVVVHHLQTHHLGGLAFDVAWSEPFDPDDAVLKFPNVIITPHVAGATEFSFRFMAKEIKLGEMTTSVLFCGHHCPASHNYTREYLQSHPFIEVDVVPLEDVPDVIGNYDICVVKSMRLNSDIIATAKKMKLIMQFGVGLEGVDINAATRHGIKVARIPGYGSGNAASCAEMAIYLMLALLRKQYEMHVAVMQKRIGDPIGDTLLGKTIFIMGFGNIGIHLAKRLRPFGVKILATKRNWSPLSSCDSNDENRNLLGKGTDDLVDEKGSHDEDILKFASRADIVVCCLEMNTETVGIVDKDFLSSMRKGALLVNIARGGLLDYDAVLDHLAMGHLGGLAIDVAWYEPFDPNDVVLKFPNVVITPHVGGVTECSYRFMAKVVGDVALQLHRGESLAGIETVN